MGKSRNRTAGHKYERVLVQRFRRLFPHIITSREGNRSRDAMGVDLVNRDEMTNGRLPVNIQAKNVLLGTLSYVNVLESMPVEPGIINVIFHNATRKHGSKFLTAGEYVFLTAADFELLLEAFVNQKSDEKTSPAD